MYVFGPTVFQITATDIKMLINTQNQCNKINWKINCLGKIAKLLE